MNRRDFTSYGLGAAFAAFIPAAAGAQSKSAVSPSDLAKELPSAQPVPGACASLSELPAPPLCGYVAETPSRLPSQENSDIRR